MEAQQGVKRGGFPTKTTRIDVGDGVQAILGEEAGVGFWMQLRWQGPSSYEIILIARSAISVQKPEQLFREKLERKSSGIQLWLDERCGLFTEHVHASVLHFLTRHETGQGCRHAGVDSALSNADKNQNIRYLTELLPWPAAAMNASLGYAATHWLQVPDLKQLAALPTKPGMPGILKAQLATPPASEDPESENEAVENEVAPAPPWPIPMGRLSLAASNAGNENPAEGPLPSSNGSSQSAGGASVSRRRFRARVLAGPRNPVHPGGLDGASVPLDPQLSGTGSCFQSELEGLVHTSCWDDGDLLHPRLEAGNPVKVESGPSSDTASLLDDEEAIESYWEWDEKEQKFRHFEEATKQWVYCPDIFD